MDLNMTNQVSEAKRIIAAFVALMLGGSVPLEWSDNTAAMTADGVIRLPAPRVGDEAEIAMLTRLAVHEAGHKEHTQGGFDLRLSAKEVGFFNAIEDARMEGCQVRKYPGATVVLSRGLGETLDSLQAKLDTGLVPPSDHTLQLDLIIRGMLELAPHEPLTLRAERLLESLQDYIEPKQREALDQALYDLPTLTSSIEAEQLTRQLVARLIAVPLPPPPKGPDEGEDEGSKQASEGDESQEVGSSNSTHAEDADGDEDDEASEAGEGEGPTQADDAASDDASDTCGADRMDGTRGSEGHSETPQGAGGKADPQGQSGAGGNSQQDAHAADSEVDLGKLIREALTERYGEEPKPGAGGADDVPSPEQVAADADRLREVFENAEADAPLEELLECVKLELSDDEPPQDGTAAGLGLAQCSAPGSLDIETRLQGIQARLVTVLQRELQDRRRRPNRLTESGGHVVASRFWRLRALGDTRIFATRAIRHGIDAAATVLLDKSGSMKDELERAAQVALAFSLALQRLGRVATSVSTFPGISQITEVLQPFGASPRSCAKACAQLVADGGTPLGHAMLIEIPRLLAQRRPKNWLVVVTDDGPADAPQVLQAMKLAQDNNVEVVGVAIGCDISAFIPRSVTITDANELPTALAKMFREGIAATVPA
jgi:cobalamin biosynthesis protein CobT